MSTLKCSAAKPSTPYDFNIVKIKERYIRGAKQGGGGVGGTPVNPPPDFEKKIFRGGWLPLN